VSYITISSWRWWRWMLSRGYGDSRIGIFRKNLPGVITGRCGFFIFGLEIGSRNPGDPVGSWLIRHRIWRW
jgi:hypothetical protein